MKVTWLGIGLLLIGSVVCADEFRTGSPLQGHIEKSAPPQGDQFNSNSTGPTTTNQPGVGGSPFCRLRDTECGGTDRRCYDDAYQSKAVVLPVPEMQARYGETRGQIWIRCGVCGSNAICWPRPEYRDLIADKGGGTQPGYVPTPPRNKPPANDPKCPETPTGPPNSGALNTSGMQKRDWYVRRIEEIKIIDKGHGRFIGDSDLAPPYRALVNGTFFGAYPAGPIIIPGQPRQRGDPKTAYRGAVAVVGKTIQLRRQNGYDWPAVDPQFKGATYLMGGGTMLIEAGRKIAESDLTRCQKFADRSGDGFNSDQLNHGMHMVLADHGGTPYLIFTKRVVGQDLQNELYRAGFTNAVMFDGGAAAYLNAADNPSWRPRNRGARFGVLIR